MTFTSREHLSPSQHWLSLSQLIDMRIFGFSIRVSNSNLATQIFIIYTTYLNWLSKLTGIIIVLQLLSDEVISMSEQEFYVFHNISSVDLYPIQFGKEKCDPCHHYGPTLTHNYLFHYILSGRGSFLENEKHEAIQLGPGQGFLMPPNTVCSYTADQDDPRTYCWIEQPDLYAS